MVVDGCWIGGGSPFYAINCNIWISGMAGRCIYPEKMVAKHFWLQMEQWSSGETFSNILKKGLLHNCYIPGNATPINHLWPFNTQDSFPSRRVPGCSRQLQAYCLLCWGWVKWTSTAPKQMPLPLCFALRPGSPLIHPHHGLSCTSGSPEQCQILQDGFDSTVFPPHWQILYRVQTKWDVIMSSSYKVSH